MCDENCFNLVCLLSVRNGVQDLPGYFESVSRFADAVVALDDGSTDDTETLLRSQSLVKVLLSNPRREGYAGWDDAANRNALLAAAGYLRPRWILSLDADERISPDDAGVLLAFLKEEAVPGAAYGFLVHRMIDTLETCDDHTLWVYRLFHHRPGQRFPRMKLHFVPVPTDIPRGHWAKTTIRIQHLSSLTEQRRGARYQKYVESDPDCKYQAGYGNLLEPPSNPRPWPDREPGQDYLVSPQRHARIAAQISGCGHFLDPLDPDRLGLSVVVISQNDRHRIGEVMQSLVAQELDRPFEVILVNSGGDGTAQFVMENFPSVRVIHLPEPALPGKARNAGLKVASGDFITFPGSHIVTPPGSLQHRVDTHEKGYAMVTGTVINGNCTWAGWASYFLDHWIALPNRPSAQLSQPPSSASYMRGLLLAIGGFPEDRRTGEDTVVNNELFKLGHKAYRSAEIHYIHRSPCGDPATLLHHHYQRGRGFGKLLWEYSVKVKGRRFRFKRIWWLLTRYPVRRICLISRDVMRYGQPCRRHFFLSLPLIMIGILSAALGAATYFLRPEPLPQADEKAVSAPNSLANS